MFFTIKKDLILEQINIVQRGIPLKTTLPIQLGIKFEVKENELVLTSHSSDIYIQTIIKDKSLIVKEEGVLVIPGKLLIDILRKVNSTEVDFAVIEYNIVVIKSGKTEFKLKTLDYNEYPDIEFIKDKQSFEIDSKVLFNIINKTNYATAQNEKRPTLTGINIKSEGNKISAIGTDSFRLSRFITHLDYELPEFNVIIPNKSLEELHKTIENINEKIKVFISNNKILFSFNNILFQIRLLDGIFPNTSNVIPKEFPIEIIFNKNDLLEAVDRVSLLINKEKEFSYKLVGLTLNKDNIIEITCKNQMYGDGIDEITPIEVISNTSFKIYASSKFLTDALRNYESDVVKISFSGEIKPFIITSEKDEGFLNLILPARYDE